MKKVLLLALIFASMTIDATSCSLRSSSNCQTFEGFMAEQKVECAGTNTNCRTTFCNVVCTPCPQAPNVKAACINNCTGFVLTGSEAEVKAIHDKLASCPYLGEAASYEYGLELTNGNKVTQDLANAIPDLVKEYQKKAEASEQTFAAASQAHNAATVAANNIREAAKTIYKSDPSQGSMIAENLIGLLNRKAQQKAGTYNPSTDPTLTTSLSRRGSRRSLARQESAFL